MTDDIDIALEGLAENIRDLHSSMERVADLLETISDGLFELNLHVGAGVDPWTGGSRGTSTTEFAPTATGSVKWYDAQKGFGFLVCDGDGHEVFLASAGLLPGTGTPHANQRLAFSVVSGEHGPMAIDIRPLE